MAAADDPQTPSEAARVLGEVADRAEAADQPAAAAISPQAHAALSEARHHLDAAWHTSDAGTDLGDAARLRRVKQAALAGMRPVTSHQVPFNRELVVAVDRLMRVVEELGTRLEAVDTLEERYDGTLKRVQAGVATVEVQLDDLADDTGRSRGELDDALARLAAVERALEDLRQQAGATRTRQDLVLRAARELAGDDAPRSGLAAVAAEAAPADAALLRRIGVAGRPASEELLAWAAAVADVVSAAAAAAPVLDLDPDRGEWLDAWTGLDLAATGVDADDERAATLRERGHDVTTADPVTHLAAARAGSLGAVTASVLADVRPLADLVAVVDGALAALRPGGALVLAAAHPAAAPADPQWADPRRRPLHPEALVLLALERGFAEAEAVALGAPTGTDGAPRAYALVARTAGGAPAEP